jgi:hypothetical protein
MSRLLSVLGASFLVLGALLPIPRLWFLVRSWLVVLVCSFLVDATAAGQEQRTKNQEPRTKVDEPYRPEAGKFPAWEKALSYRGELVFVDHVNRRGSIRVQGEGT